MWCARVLWQGDYRQLVHELDQYQYYELRLMVLDICSTYVRHTCLASSCSCALYIFTSILLGGGGCEIDGHCFAVSVWVNGGGSLSHHCACVSFISLTPPYASHSLVLHPLALVHPCVMSLINEALMMKGGSSPEPNLLKHRLSPCVSLSRLCFSTSLPRTMTRLRSPGETAKLSSTETTDGIQPVYSDSSQIPK